MAKLLVIAVALLLGTAACSTICKYDPASIPLPGCATPTPAMGSGANVVQQQNT